MLRVSTKGKWWLMILVVKKCVFRYDNDLL